MRPVNQRDNQMIRIEIDLNGAETLAYDFFKGLEQYRGKIISFLADGPGGGNPAVIIQFQNESDAEQYIKNWYHNGEDFGDENILEPYQINPERDRIFTWEEHSKK